MLQGDPALEGVAAVIFDEFHERSLQADLGLALTLDARENLAPELKLLVMSATLDGTAVAKLLADAPVVISAGRMFPVESRFVGSGLPMIPGAPSPRAGHGPGAHGDAIRFVAQMVQRALREEQGDVLVFLPGAGEIRRVQTLLLESGARVLPLYGDLSAADQDDVLMPARAGERKVVLATNIAETSLTIEGVRVVVDSGLVRRSMFDPATGMGRLETQRISRASADQRQGRAGRLEAGVCYRAWSEGAHASLAAFTPPEISTADLVPLALELASWGVRDAATLRWLDAPPAAMLASARDLLKRLDALDASGVITAQGRQMSQLAVHPRLAHMLLKARDLDAVALAADLSALLSERDLLRGARDPDVRSRLELLEGRSGAAHKAALSRVRRMSQDLARQLTRSGEQGTAPPSARSTRSQAESRSASNSTVSAGLLLAFAYPDRMGRRRGGDDGSYTLASGHGAKFAEAHSLSRAEFIVAVDLDDRDRDARILLAAPLTRAEIEQYLSDRLERTDEVSWDSRTQAVVAREVVRLDALILEEKPLRELPAGAREAAMLTGIRELGIAALPWTPDTRDLQARMEFVRTFNSGVAWPNVSDAQLLSALEEWLSPWLQGITRKDHLARIPLGDALRALLTWEQQKELDKLAPAHLEVPTGSRIRIDYLDESAPAVSVRLQEVFGLERTPLIGGGHVPITFKLLSPARRPVQVTRDLASFWRGAYADVRKDLRGRYPKHHWPENPLEAEPVRGIR
jgi:ATP-dependent helicase HrpB